MASKPEGHGFTRDTLTLLAQRMNQDIPYYHRMIQNAPDEVLQRAMIIGAEWGRWGCQSVELPATFAAALMATDAKDALNDQELPWPAFEVQVPAGLLRSGLSDIFSVMIGKIPPEVHLSGAIANAKYFIVYYDYEATATSTYASLENMFSDKIAGIGTYLNEEFAEIYDEDLERRVWQMIHRLLAGVILTVNQARADKPEVFPNLPRKEKRGHWRINTHRVGQALTIDTRTTIRDYVAGASKSTPSIATCVRGHWRNQAYGERWSKHKKIWVKPFYRGSEGPLNIRTTRIKPPEE